MKKAFFVLALLAAFGIGATVGARSLPDKFSRRIPKIGATPKGNLETALTASICAHVNTVTGVGVCSLDRVTEVKFIRIGTGASREWEARYWVSIPGTHTPDAP
jgi:hypothetical protein